MEIQPKFVLGMTPDHRMEVTPPMPGAHSRQRSLVNRNVVVDGHRTSVRLELEMWDALFEIERCERRSVHAICSDVDATRRASTLTSGLRVYILDYFRRAATPDSHHHAGHGADCR